MSTTTNPKRPTAVQLVRDARERNAPRRARVLANIERLRAIAAARRAEQPKPRR